MAARPPFEAILGHFGSFWALLGLFWPFLAIRVGATAPSGSGPPIWGKMGRGQNWWVPRAQVPSRPTFGAIFGHFEPFWALLGLFWPFLAIWVEGRRLQVGPDPLKLE